MRWGPDDHGPAPEDGYGHPVRFARWLTPNRAEFVRLDGVEWLRWQVSDDPRGHTWRDVDPETLEMTTGLDEVDWTPGGPDLLPDLIGVLDPPVNAEALCSFIERWGAPEICAHGHLHGHRGHKPLSKDFPEIHVPMCGWAEAEGQAAVRVAHLIRWAQVCRAMMRAGAHLRSGRRVSAYDARVLWPAVVADEDPAAREDAAVVRTPALVALDVVYLQRAVEEAFLGAGLHITYSWDAGEARPTVQMGVRGPIGAALLQAALATAQADGFAVCSGCAQPFVPKRAPRAGARVWCAACGRQAAVRDAQRRYRERKKAEAAAARGAADLHEHRAAKSRRATGKTKGDGSGTA